MNPNESTRPRRFEVVVACVAALSLALAACGGASPSPTAPNPTTASPTAAKSTATMPVRTASPTQAVTQGACAIAGGVQPTWIPSDRPHPYGPMGVGRQIHAATRVADGRVLITGGYDYCDVPLASAMVYDPGARAFSATATMSVGRGYQTSTLLQNGLVLIAGGGEAGYAGALGEPFLASAELFDPATGTFRPTGSMSVTRQDHTATVLKDGRVLIVGGDDVREHALATAELYDPSTGTFSETGSMSEARGFHTATLLDDGRVLVTGGVTNGNWHYTGVNTAELYDPATGTFSKAGEMEYWSAWHTATLLLDGRVLLTGGTGGDGDDHSAELFDPRTDTFIKTAMMETGRIFHTATLLSDGRVLVVGGGRDYTHRKFIAAAEIWDPATGAFSATGPMTDARTFHAATLLADGRVLVTGGYGSTAPLANGEIWDPATGVFTPAS